jgi:hypothetical protein
MSAATARMKGVHGSGKGAYSMAIQLQPLSNELREGDDCCDGSRWRTWSLRRERHRSRSGERLTDAARRTSAAMIERRRAE